MKLWFFGVLKACVIIAFNYGVFVIGFDWLFMKMEAPFTFSELTMARGVLVPLASMMMIWFSWEEIYPPNKADRLYRNEVMKPYWAFFRTVRNVSGSRLAEVLGDLLFQPWGSKLIKVGEFDLTHPDVEYKKPVRVDIFVTKVNPLDWSKPFPASECIIG